MARLFQILGKIFQRYSVTQRIVIVVIFIGIISSIISLLVWASRPEFEVLYSDLDPSGASAIVSELRGMKVQYKLENNGRTVLVPAESVAELRLKFADSGYNSQKVAGYEVFDNVKNGMTNYMQQINMRRALEGELIKTISQFPEVRNCRVHLVLPENNLFEQESKGSASVVLYLRQGRTMHPSQVKGITALVSNSVKGIAAQDVVVVDSDGNLLTQAQSEDDILGSTGTQWDIKHQEEVKMQTKIKDIVESIVGAQNAVVKVSLDMNFEKIERTTELPDPDNVVVISEESHIESSNSSDTVGNQNNRRQNENTITNYEIGQTREHYVSSVGTIKRVSVAVLLNGKYKTSTGEKGAVNREYVPWNSKDLTQITALVKSAIGFNEQRGDVVEVQNIQLETAGFDLDREYFIQADRQEMIQNLINKGLMFLGIIAGYMVIRRLLKSSSTALNLPANARAFIPVSENTAAAMLAAEEQEEIPEDIYIKKLSPEAKAKLKAKDKMTSNVIEYAKSSPEDAAKLIRSWLTQPKNG
jgi:flagellar M-ring protein FliF